MDKISRSMAGMSDDPLWFKDAVIYQLHVKSFFDGTDDGVGDFQGLTRKLDHLQDLGVSAIWLMPFCPSPLRDDGYDIADYRNIHPAYGTLRDFKKFLAEAHRRGLRVITELVVNHTSDQHAWFQRARRAMPGSTWRDWYVWSDTPQRYNDARIIFQDFETSNWTWDPVAGAYFWHRFYSHQPDLNYDHPPVRKAILATLDFWYAMGVDGLRLDAIPYLFEREGSNCENLPETHRFLKEMRAHVDAKFKNRMLLGEANQWPEDAVAYFGDSDECHMAFHFPLMPRLFMALHMEDRFPVLDILDQTPAIPENCQWAIFLRNHDELTLEMVTDEERDYMYQVYAQDPRMRINLGIRRRLFPLLGNHRRLTELANALLFSLPGSPVIYYGDEIGMGDNVYLGDRDGVRTPMQWSPDRNAGFSRADPQKLMLPVIISPEYHYEVINVEVQQANPHSTLWGMKRLIALRKRFKAFSRGAIEFLTPDNHRILAFIRRYENERLLVVCNLSRFVQHVQLDLSACEGMIPVELFGRTPFPPIEAIPYFLSLGPHSFYWFYLTPSQTVTEGTSTQAGETTVPEVEADCEEEDFLSGKAVARIEAVLPGFLTRSRWFGGKARPLKQAVIVDMFSLTKDSRHWAIALVRVSYLSGDTEMYTVPMALVPENPSNRLWQEHPQAVIARFKLKCSLSAFLLCDAMADAAFGEALLAVLARKRILHGRFGQMRGITTHAFRTLIPQDDLLPLPTMLGGEQSNTSIRFGDRLILKLIRKLVPGVNPGLEIGRLLTEMQFPYCAPTLGAIELRLNQDEPMTIAILQGFMTNRGDAWTYALDCLGHYFEAAMGQPPLDLPAAFPVDLLDVSPSVEAAGRIGVFLESARLLGRRTAEMHKCLASEQSLPEFKPEAFSKLYQRALYQSLRNQVGKVLPMLRRQFNRLPEGIRPLAVTIMKREKDLMNRYKELLETRIGVVRIRCHGDYHLAQVLFTGSDFIIIDFEGEPSRPITERRIKRSALRDVAGMLRSFHYAAHVARLCRQENGIAPEAVAELAHRAEFWQRWVSAEFLKSYLQEADGGRFIPGSRNELRVLLGVLLLEKAVYELSYELNNRPDWVGIPLRGISQLLGDNDN
jgi:maltose alpha-D-glucosyltransferase/alpha-amylase